MAKTYLNEENMRDIIWGCYADGRRRRRLYF